MYLRGSVVGGGYKAKKILVGRIKSGRGPSLSSLKVLVMTGQSETAGPCRAPFKWDVPPVTVLQQPDSGEGTGRVQVLGSTALRQRGQDYRRAGSSAPAALPPHPGAGFPLK